MVQTTAGWSTFRTVSTYSTAKEVADLLDPLQSFNYTPRDIYWGQLAGCLEAIDAGTTFLLGHCHGCTSPEHCISMNPSVLDQY